MEYNYDVSVILVSYNTSKLTCECLESIFARTSNRTFEVVVVDNASCDSTCEDIRASYPQVKLISESRNLGFGPAVNLGVKNSTGRAIFLINSDAILQNNVIDILYETLFSNTNYKFVGPRICGANGNPGAEFSRFFPGFLSELNFVTFNLFGKLLYGKNLNYNADTKPLCFSGALSGAALIFARDTFDVLKGFDERFFLYYEETDFEYRAHRAGGLVVNNPSAVIFHSEGASSPDKTQAYVLSFESKKKYYKKHLTLVEAIAADCLFIMGARLRLAIFFLLRNEKKIYYWKQILTAYRISCKKT